MSPNNKKKLLILRKKLDVIDNKLLNLLKIRANHVKRVLSLKEFKKEIIDKKRINLILKNVRSKSIKKGIDPNIATKNQASDENRKVCCKFNLNSFSRLVRINKTPKKIVIKEEDKKL